MRIAGMPCHVLFADPDLLSPVHRAFCAHPRAGHALRCGKDLRGRQACGIHVGCGAHILAASIGLPVLFHHYPALYHAVRLAGAAYLVWLGCGMIRRACLAMEEGGPASPESFGETFRQSAIVEMLNPKTGIFFLTQLPLYADPAGDLPLWQQFLLLGVVVNLIFSLGDLCGILFAGTAHRLCSHAPQRRLRQGSGLLIAGIGLSIVVATC